MSYKGKIYVAFDALNDTKAYNQLKDFRQSDGSIYDFYDGARYAKDLDKISDENLKALIQQNMEDADIILILLSKTLKSMRRFSKWQIEYAISKNKPIIVLNNSPLRGLDYDITPTPLKNHLCLYVPYDTQALELACMNWPRSNKEHHNNNDKNPYRYDSEVYKQLFNEEEDKDKE